MIALLLVLIPLVSGLLLFALQAKAAKNLSFFISTALFILAAASFSCYANNDNAMQFNMSWLPSLGANFNLSLDGLSKILTLLCVFVFPIIFVALFNRQFQSSYYALMLLAQAGMMGVFLAKDGLLFYFFWELALIPVYFLCSRWGNENRIKASFKFFIYTFAGSLLMLAGLIYLQQKEPMGSFDRAALAAINLTDFEKGFLFWLFFIAFAIKMPIFPFHTWQPDAYEQSNTGTTMVLSSVMVKMGLFATICWLLYLFPNLAPIHKDIVIGLSVFGMLYASFIAMQQDDLKRIVAYSSIAHIGLMCAALFTLTKNGWQGATVQMFAHGVNVLGMWMVVEYIEQRTGKKKMSELGGLAHSQPILAIVLVVIALANVALPLTNAFVGEFLMFNGLFEYNKWVAAIAGLSIIFAAVYTLRMIQYVMYGEAKNYEHAFKMQWYEAVGFGFVIVAIIGMGVYPKPILDTASEVFKYLP
jgi:NADH-quinone oxidoreductase subunit M